MFERDLEKLLGGFAVDTSVPEKRIRLYIAAMQAKTRNSGPAARVTDCCKP